MWNGSVFQQDYQWGKQLWDDLDRIGLGLFRVCSAGPGTAAPPATSGRKKRMEGVSRENIAEERMWRKRPDGIAAIKMMPTATKSAGFTVERMSDATNQYMLCEQNETSSRGPIRIHQIRGMYSMSEVQREPLRQSCLGAGLLGPTRTAQGRGE